jgi:hypothetical protein
MYVGRGLDPALAARVADQLMTHDALGAHARDELGFTPTLEARPIQAALASGASFTIGAATPLIVTVLAPETSLLYAVAVASLFVLAALGALAAWAGGARIARGALRVTFWGALAMGVTAGAGALRHGCIVLRLLTARGTARIDPVWTALQRQPSDAVGNEFRGAFNPVESSAPTARGARSTEISVDVFLGLLLFGLIEDLLGVAELD